MFASRNILSKVCIVLIVLIGFLVNSDFKQWRETEGVIQNDIRNYYGDLPAKYIYEDIKVERDNYQYTENGYWFWIKSYDSGKYDFGKTYGLALLYSPFFWAGHVAAKLFGYPETGFSEPYKYFLLLSALFYLFLGLFIVRELLLNLEFSDKVTSLTLLLLGLGTNLFAYSTQSGPYPHVYNFFLIAVFIYYTVKWHDEGKSMFSFVCISLSLALITLISFSNTVIVLFFILYQLKSFDELGKKQIPLFQILVLVIIMFLIWLPQLNYWKMMTGSILGATDHSEKYFFSNPVFLKGLFSFRKGWLVYTPVMILAISGVLLLYRKMKSLSIAIVITSIASLYVTFSWWNWWYGGSFGQRALVDTYALYSIPLAALISYLFTKTRLVKLSFAGLIIFLIWLNLFQTYQYQKGSLHYSAMSKNLYIKQFGKLDKIEGFDSFLDLPNDVEAKSGKR